MQTFWQFSVLIPFSRLFSITSGISSIFSIFQYRMEPSREPEITLFPHFEPSTAVTQSWWPRSGIFASWSLMFHTITRLSKPPETMSCDAEKILKHLRREPIFSLQTLASSQHRGARWQTDRWLCPFDEDQKKSLELAIFVQQMLKEPIFDSHSNFWVHSPLIDILQWKRQSCEWTCPTKQLLKQRFM